MSPISEVISHNSTEIAECAWLPLRTYIDSTQQQALERKVPDTMNSFFMKGVEAMLQQGMAPAKWGWAETDLPTHGGGSKEHITGWTTRPNYMLYHPQKAFPEY